MLSFGRFKGLWTPSSRQEPVTLSLAVPDPVPDPHPVPVPVPAPAPEPELEKKPVRRTASTSSEKVLDLLKADPNLTAGEIAGTLGVSKDYAGTLLNKARTKMVESPGPVPLSRIPAVSEPEGDLRDSMAEIQRSLERMQTQLLDLLATPTPLPANFLVGRRANVLALQQRGRAVQEIADELSINPGEVEFILKTDRMLAEFF